MSITIRILLVFTLVLYLLCGYISWDLYTCKIKRARPACAVDTASMDHPLLFKWGLKTPMDKDGLLAYLDSAATKGINDSTQLLITGLYHPAEPLPGNFPNIGWARAEELKAMISEGLGISSKDIRTASELSDEVLSDQRMPFMGIALSFEKAIDTKVSITQTGNSITIRFPSNESVKEVKPSVQAYFRSLAARLERSGESVVITGHTDDVGSNQVNYQLGLERANFIKDLIQASLNDTSKVISASKGEEEPIADNATEEGRQANRRVEVIIIPSDSIPLPSNAKHLELDTIN